MERTLTQKPAYVPGEWIKAHEVCELLGIKYGTLKNIISKKKVPERFMTVGLGGNRLFYRNGVLGFEQ